MSNLHDNKLIEDKKINSEEFFAAIFLLLITLFVLKQIHAWIDIATLPLMLKIGWVSAGTFGFLLMGWHFFRFFSYNENPDNSNAWGYKEVVEKW